MAGVTTPTQALLLLAALVAFVVLGRLSRGDREEAGARAGRRLRTAWRRPWFRLRRPSRARAHLIWLAVSALLAFAVAHGVAVPLFLLVFFALWLTGFGLLGRVYR